ncbi:hypothetical protein ACGTNG_04620 [Halomonas sp. 1390]|uniref:hypothetical protein n=1 Tax=Halomonas sp. B23F22_3 TaxID=3459516 RepID=UPI00373F3836
MNLRTPEFTLGEIPSPFNRVDHTLTLDPDDLAPVLKSVHTFWRGKVPAGVKPRHLSYREQYGVDLFSPKRARMPEDPCDLSPSALLQACYAIVPFVDASHHPYCRLDLDGSVYSPGAPHPSEHPDPGAEAIVKVYKPLATFLGGVLPVIGAAIFGIRATADFRTAIRQSERMTTELDDLGGELEAALEQADRARVVQLLGKLSRSLSYDLKIWSMVYSERDLAPGF